MTYPDISRDPPRDEDLARLLAESDPARVAGAEFGALRAAIRVRATGPLSRMRLQLAWWEHAARWARPAVPLALAAGMAMIWLLGTITIETLENGTVAAAPPFLEEVLTSRLPDIEYDLLVAEETEMEAMVEFAFQGR